MPTYEAILYGRAIYAANVRVMRVTGLSGGLPTPPTPQPGVPLAGQIFPLAEGLFHPCITVDTNIGGEGGGGGGVTGEDYRALILADAPRSYWRLGDVPEIIGASILDELGLNNGQALVDNYGLPGEGGAAFGDIDGLLLGDDNRALLFGGYGYVNVGVGQGLQLQRFTLEVVARLASNPPLAGTPNFGAQPLFSYDSTDSNLWGRGYHFYLTTAGRLKVQIGDGLGVWFGAEGATVLAPATVYHLAATFDGYSLKVYINGVLDGQANLGGLKVISYTNATGLTLALNPAGSNPPVKYTGVLDEAAIYPAALEAAALLRHKVKALG